MLGDVMKYRSLLLCGNNFSILDKALTSSFTPAVPKYNDTFLQRRRESYSIGAPF